MFHTQTTPDPKTGGYFIAAEAKTAVDVNPAYYYAMHEKEVALTMARSYFKLLNQRLGYVGEKKIIERAARDWQVRYQAALKYELPEMFKKILFSTKKKEQIELLREARLNHELFFAFIIQSSDTFGYKFSVYTFEHKPKQLIGKKYPRFIYRNPDNEIETAGKTDLTNNQLHLAITENHRVIVNFFAKGGVWHCLFRTMKGIYGKEKAHEAEPHMHYVSSAWGYSRAQVLEELAKERYSLKSAHLPFDPREKDDNTEG